MKNREAIAIISIIIANMIFGSTIIATKIILNTGFPVLFLLAWRMTIAALSLSILFAFHIFKGNITWPRLKKLLPLGLISPCLYFTAESIGIQMTSGAISGSILAMIPIATLLISQLTFKEKHPRLQIAAILLSIAGVILITLAGDCELVFDPLGYL
ncbi:MAG: DMT family transporter, partial [Clostridiales bacterium]